MATLETLDGAKLKQGDRIDYYSIVMQGRTDLEASHPLRDDGLQTVGYTLRFVAKPDLSLADNDVSAINITVDTGASGATADSAPLLILPSDTNTIVFGNNDQLNYFWDVQLSDGGDYIYTIATGGFTLIRDVALTP